MADERDFAILSHLRKDPFMSYENLGRGVGLSGKAVKTRLEALQKNKILTSLQAVPAAQVFRRQPRLFFFERRASQEKLDGAVEVDPVVFATVDVNGSAAVLLYHRPGAQSYLGGSEPCWAVRALGDSPLSPSSRGACQAGRLGGGRCCACLFSTSACR